MTLRLLPIALVLATLAITSPARPIESPWKECVPAAITPTPPDQGWGNGGCEHDCGAPYCPAWLRGDGVRPGECVPTEIETNCRRRFTVMTVYEYFCQATVDPTCPVGSQTICEWELVAGSGSATYVIDCKNI